MQIKIIYQYKLTSNMINIKSVITSTRWTWFVRTTTRIFNHTKHLTKHELILSANLPRLPLSCASLLIKWLNEPTIPSLSLLPHPASALLCLRSDLLMLSNHLCLPILLTGLLNLAEQTLIIVRCLEWMNQNRSRHRQKWQKWNHVTHVKKDVDRW